MNKFQKNYDYIRRMVDDLKKEDQKRRIEMNFLKEEKGLVLLCYLIGIRFV